MRQVIAAVAVLVGLAVIACADSTHAQTAPPATQAGTKTAPATRLPQPKWISGPEADFPDTEKALGHNGGVRVRGVVGVDGKLSDAQVVESSRADVLDANALKAAVAQVYQPAKDADGAPIAAPFEQTFRFDNYRAREGVGAAQYGCRQFVLDMDWWKQAFPESAYREHQFYTMMRGLGVIARMGQQGAMRAFTAESNDAYEARWLAAIAWCRAHPDKRFADAMKPEGDYLLNMERRSKR